MKKRPLPAAVNGGHLPRSKGQQRSAASASEQAVRHDDESPFAQMDLTPTQRRFLSTFSVVGRIDRATEISQVGKWSHQGWMKRPNYREAYQRARRMAGDAIESEAIRRAVEGVRRMRFYQGRPIMVPQLDEVGRPVRDEETDEVVMTPYFEFEYSDTLLITLLKGLFPRRYGARSEVKMSVRSGQRVAGKTPQQCIEETLERLQQLAGVGSTASVSSD